MQVVRKNNNKIHEPIPIFIATIFGGPLVAGYLIYSNFKTLNESTKARLSLLLSITIFLTILIKVRNMFMTNITNLDSFIVIVSWSSAFLVYIIIYFFQKNKIANFIKTGGLYYSRIVTILIGVGTMILVYLIIFSILVSINISIYNKQHKTGDLFKNEWKVEYFKETSIKQIYFAVFPTAANIGVTATLRNSPKI